MKIYNDTSNECERHRQAYEDETIHGADATQQKKWLETGG